MIYLRFWLGLCSCCHLPRLLCRIDSDFPRYRSDTGCFRVWRLGK